MVVYLDTEQEIDLKNKSMMTIDLAAKDPSINRGLLMSTTIKIAEVSFKAGVEFAQRWISVEDPPKYGIEIFVKFSNGTHSSAYYLKHKYRGDSFYNYPEPDIEFILKDVISWRPIEIK